MLLAVVSDTHGHVPFTLDAIREIERRNPDLVLHCGDVGSPAVVALFAGRPNRFVFGTDWPLVPIAPYRQFIASVIPAHFHSAVFEENARMLFRLPG